MNAEYQEMIRVLVREAFGPLSKATGFKSYNEAIVALREEFRNNAASPALWIHKQVEEVYPACQGNTVDPKAFLDILGIIDTEDKLVAVTREMPDEEFPIIQKFLLWFTKEFLPARRAAAKLMLKHLPQYRRGGPKVIMPSDSECRQIFKEVMEEYSKSGSMGEAQMTVARKKKVNVRMIQRIKAKVLAENKSLQNPNN
jgi:hypothetical protein